MALAVLSPWPGNDAARNCLDEALDGIGDFDGDETGERLVRRNLIDRLGTTAAALVQGHAPGAPQAIKNEAVIRLAGWLQNSRPDDIVQLSASPPSYQQSTAFGQNEAVQFRHNPSRNALRLSGAAGLLAPWRSPGVTIIEAAS